MLSLITGPARSGKSEWAELLAARSCKPTIYIATAQRDRHDPEWEERLQRHQVRRPDSWQTWEVPIDLAGAIAAASPSSYLLVDSLGTWLANLLAQSDADWRRCQSDLLVAVRTCPAELAIVAEEVGWGVVPAYELGRRFRDRLGDTSRKLGSMANSVYLVTGGYAIDLVKFGERLPDPNELSR